MADEHGARYVRRFLRHPDFDSSAKRLGKIIRAHSDGLTVIASRHDKPAQTPWLCAV
ncbi:MAG: hypothetical protein ABI680_10290 [Chthoniobacteraceae bacterium]